MTFKAALLHFAVILVAVLAGPRIAAAEPLQLVGFGDSLMAGYGLNPGESFPEKLEKALRNNGHDVVITNAGVSGDTTSGGLSRLDWSVPDGTQLVILELGANDGLRGLPPQLLADNLKAMIAAATGSGARVLLVGMQMPPNYGPAYTRRFSAVYRELAEREDLPLVPFLMDGFADRPELFLADGIHPTADAQALILDTVWAKLQPMLTQADARAQRR